jgi:hypothetical protein
MVAERSEVLTKVREKKLFLAFKCDEFTEKDYCDENGKLWTLKLPTDFDLKALGFIRAETVIKAIEGHANCRNYHGRDDKTCLDILREWLLEEYSGKADVGKVSCKGIPCIPTGCKREDRNEGSHPTGLSKTPDAIHEPARQEPAQIKPQTRRVKGE